MNARYAYDYILVYRLVLLILCCAIKFPLESTDLLSEATKLISQLNVLISSSERSRSHHLTNLQICSHKPLI